MSRFERDFNSIFHGADRAFKPHSVEDLKLIAKAKADVAEGKPTSSTHPIYLETYSLEKSYQLIGGQNERS